MSRIGKQPIPVPAGVEVGVEGSEVMIKGPKGELRRELRREMRIVSENGVLRVLPQERFGEDPPRDVRAFWGLSRTLVANMVQGVSEGYAKRLELEGVGYRAAVEESDLVLNVGYSHPVRIKAPDGVEFTVEKNVITVSGRDKEAVGKTAATVRKARPVEPYKGKGIRYEGEQVRRKLGKKAAGS